MKKSFFPIGTIVKLYGFDKKVMIIGFCQKTQEKIYDYCGVTYPFGFEQKKNILYFNISDIVQMVRVGLLDIESMTLLSKIKELNNNK